MSVPHFLDRGGYRLAYYDDGDSGAETVVCSHGFFMDSSMFDPLAEALVQQGYRVLRIDARGHGKTTRQGEESQHGFTYWDSAEDLLAVLDHVGVEQAHLVGHSQGGFTSMRVALGAPGRVASLSLIASSAQATDPGEKVGFQQTFAAFETGNPPDEVLKPLTEVLLGDDPAVRDHWVPRWLSMPWRELGPAASCLLERDDISARLAEITVPALLMRGERDGGKAALAYQYQLAENLGSTLIDVYYIPGAAHAIPVTHAKTVNQLLCGFLQRVSSR